MNSLTRYADVKGLGVAYQVTGEGPLTLVLSPGSFANVDVLLEDPSAALYFRRLSGFCRLVRFDVIGSGASDRLGPSTEVPAFVDQLTAVVNAAGVDSFALMAFLDSGYEAIEYAARRPTALTHLLFWNATARLTTDEDYPIGTNPDVGAQLIEALEASWGTPEMARLQVPSRADDAAFVDWYAKFLRSVATPSQLKASVGRTLVLDARESLAAVEVPTLVMHRANYLMIPAAQGRYMAEQIPNADYLELPGADGPLYWEEPEMSLAAIERFITGRTTTSARRAIKTVLFTDIVRSTERAHSLGDRDWAAVLNQHNEIATKWISAYSGRAVKGTGDGVLAVFDDPHSAVQAAQAIRPALEAISIEVRMGMHTGEVEETEGDIRGLAVSIAARVMHEAEPGDLLASRTVRDLLIGSRATFSDRGEHELKGIPEPWRLYLVEEPASV